jgi:hypothetical protein
MHLNDVGEIIARRKLYLADDKEKKIVVLIGKPNIFPDSSDYFCPFQVIGLGSEEVKYAGGFDAVQAIQLAIRMIGSELLAMNKSLNGKLRWDASESGDLGFPIK